MAARLPAATAAGDDAMDEGMRRRSASSGLSSTSFSGPPVAVLPAVLEPMQHADGPSMDDDRAPLRGGGERNALHDASILGTVSARVSALLDLPPSMPAATVAREVAINALPVAGSNVLFFASQAITMMFVGQHLGKDALAAFALGISIFNVTGNSLCVGFCGAIDTLCSQAYGRDPKGRETGVILQRAIALTLVMSLPITAAYMVAERPLVAVFGPQIGGDVALYLRNIPPYLMMNIVSYACARGLSAQLLPNASMVGVIASVVVCPFANMWLTPKGLIGAIQALTVTMAVTSSVGVATAMLHPASVLRVKAPLRELFNPTEVRAFVAVGAPTLVAVCAEWWSFELLNITLAQFGTTLIAALNISFSLLIFMFGLTSAVSIASSVCVGNALGRGDARAARGVARMGLLLGACAFTFNNIAMLAVHRWAFALYTSDADVQRELSVAALIMCVFHVGESSQNILGGIFRGAGEQRKLPRFTLPCLWCVGLPVANGAAYLAAPHHLLGALAGFAAGFYVLVPLLWRDMQTWDWDALVERAAAATTTTTTTASGGLHEENEAAP